MLIETETKKEREREREKKKKRYPFHLTLNGSQSGWKRSRNCAALLPALVRMQICWLSANFHFSKPADDGSKILALVVFLKVPKSLTGARFARQSGAINRANAWP